MSTQSVSRAQSVSRPVSSTFLQTSSALIFGAVILYAVGFLPMDAAHNAAHDTRHSLAFPCH
ncbi:CbtB domain-containing protein [Hahella ganghwensis]|uniref:CbtB domain-containing protein n=1 Tax=Hahella ganghwensis TaxID=286420 RepID=UPI00037C56C1|nr:CbtB domain-containing protein [Hahella ganghwensis]